MVEWTGGRATAGIACLHGELERSGLGWGRGGLDEAEFTTTLVAASAPNITDMPGVNPPPVKATAVPPVVGPIVGATPDTVGAGADEQLSCKVRPVTGGGTWTAALVNGAQPGAETRSS